jgi:hypothetical protein
MQPEREDGKSRARMPDASGAGEQCLGDDFLAAFDGCAGEFGETFCSAMLTGQWDGR